MSTVGLAAAAGFWVLLIILILIGISVGMLGITRAREMRGGGPVLGIIGTTIVPAGLSAGIGIEGNVTWALVLSFAAVVFSLWWLSNMAKREP